MNKTNYELKNGQVFGKLTITNPLVEDGYASTICECGALQDVRPTSLLNGAVTRCRLCIKKEHREAPYAPRKKLITDEAQAQEDRDQREIDKWLKNNTPTQL